MIDRLLTKQLEKRIDDEKVIILLGPRQVGKTTMMRERFINDKTLYFNGDDFDTRSMLQDTNERSLKNIIGDHTRVIIDEAQRIKNIGLTIKIIKDRIAGVKVIATGSSALELANAINEPLTGRKWEYTMWPISTHEMIDHTSYLDEKRSLEHRLMYGFYPDVINNPADEKEILTSLADSYLYKDLLTWENIKKPAQIEKLIQALAFQIGSEVSYQELGNMIGLDNETVERYISLLEKTFVIFRLPALSRNLRNELKKGKKIYFYDLGIRNAVISDWSPINLRRDIGSLWENFLIVERMKYKSNHRLFSNDYFWRTHAQQEIDFVEDCNGILHAYEFKWNQKKSARLSKTFEKAYPNHAFMKVSQDNYLDFIAHQL